MTSVTGLTSSEVEARRQQGQGNGVDLTTSRTYKDIILKNVFNPVNMVLYAIGLGMALVGDVRSAFATVMLVVFNATVGIIQEVRAKRQLDKIALLAVAKVSVLRDGQPSEILPSELVQDDILIIEAGDQIPVDGTLVGEGKIEVDESALTGESDLIDKEKGDEVLSGSYCITGSTLVRATGVGEGSFANKLTKGAREFSLELTPLQREVNRLLRVILLVVIFLGIVTVTGLFVLDLPTSTFLQIIAVVTGAVSAGLLVLITLNYTWGSVRIGQQGGLVQQLNAIESLSNTTVLCTDKTGTLTTNRINYHDVNASGDLEKAEFERLLSSFAASAETTNKTTEAIIVGLPGERRATCDDVPFSSARKWSAVAFDDAGGEQGRSLRGVYVLGAMEMLQPYFDVDEQTSQQLEAWSNQGLRVLAFARNADVVTLHDAEGEASLPRLELLGIVSFSDELRPHLEETLSYFTENDIKLKVISGDNPQTVAALAKQAGLPDDLRLVSGPELAGMNDAEFTAAAVEGAIFGRITPQQKERLVTVLRDQGEYVAMMGDGVNDVLSLKKANMGIAMESGSTATRSVAAMVLLNDSFEVMPAALKEGQRIVNSIQNILKLFMVTVFALLLLIVAITMLGLGFPFTTLQNTLLSFFARGAPPLVLGVTALAVRRNIRLDRSIIHFTLPASLTIFVFGLFIYVGVLFLVGNRLIDAVVTPEMIAGLRNYTTLPPEQMTEEWFRYTATLLSAQTALTSFFVYAGIMLMLFADPPTRWFTGGSDYTGNKLVIYAAIALVAGYLALLAVEPLGAFFQLVPLPWSFQLAIGGLTLAWMLLQRAMWRSNWLERFLDMGG